VPRSYLFCGICGRRSWGNEKKKVTYYHCKVRAAQHGHKPRYAQHPPAVTVREDVVQEALSEFFLRRIFGDHRRLFLAQAAEQDHQRSSHAARAAEPHRRLTDLQRRQDNIIRDLENYFHLELRYAAVEHRLTLRVTISSDAAVAFAETAARNRPQEPTEGDPPGSGLQPGYVGDLLGAACGERATTTTAVTCGNAELAIEESIPLSAQDLIESRVV